jgi:hypothetical protein
LIELSLQRGKPGFELVLPELGDEITFGDFLPFFHRQFHEHAWNLKGELDAARCFDFARERANPCVVARSNEHRFDGPDRLTHRRYRSRAAPSETSSEHGHQHDSK